MTREEIEELKGLAASMGLYDDKNPCKRAVILGKAIKALEQEPVLDKISAEIIDTLYVDSLIFGELIDFRNEKIDANDVIKEFNRIARLKALQIIDRYKSDEDTE